MKLVDINWSDAPEDATHCFVDSIGGIYWRDLSGAQARYWHAGRWISCRMSSSAFLEGPVNYVERPSAWNGEGLPPVGTVCEVLKGDETTITWEDERKFMIGKRVTVRAAFINDCDQAMCAIELDMGRCECILAKLLGPLRTPEQIKAEERKRITDDIQRVCVEGEDSGIPYHEALYDAGYRKFEIVEGE
jgi:hypothetical protein